MDFTPQDKKILSNLGRTQDGRAFVELLGRMKDHYLSLDSIPSGQDYGAHVEGRKIFKTFADTLIANIKSQSRVQRSLDPDDYE